MKTRVAAWGHSLGVIPDHMPFEVAALDESMAVALVLNSADSHFVTRLLELHG